MLFRSGKKTLWPGLTIFARDDFNAERIDIAEMKQRFLCVQAVEAARTIAEGVIVDPREADVGSILGFGFAPFTGGAISYIDGLGIQEFIILCDRLATKYGSRFIPPKLLREMAANNQTFYVRNGAAGIA